MQAANNNWPSIAILITPDFSHNKPDIEPKINGTENITAPCSIPVNGTNLPLAVQQMKAKILPNPNTKLPSNIFLLLLNCK